MNNQFDEAGLLLGANLNGIARGPTTLVNEAAHAVASKQGSFAETAGFSYLASLPIVAETTWLTDSMPGGAVNAQASDPAGTHAVDSLLRTPVEVEVGSAKAKPPQEPKPTKVQRIWGRELGKKWTPVSDYFLENFHRLAGGELSPSDAMFIIMLMRFKWDERRPFPALTTVAKSMNRTVRYVRKTCARLEEHGLLKRELSKTGGRSRYDLQPLFAALEDLKARDAVSAESAKSSTENSTEAA